jgi:hypothetical protein
MYAGGAAAIALLGVGALQMSAGAPFDYAAASEQRQQVILDEMAAALQYGLVRATGGAVSVRVAAGDAANDSVSVFGRYLDTRFEQATAEQVAIVSEALFRNNCNQHGTRQVIDDGVAIRFAIAKPSGAQLIDIQFDAQSCAPFLRKSVG